MNYQQQLQIAIDYIGKHIDDELSLDGLSQRFAISKFHFHRLFTAFTGLSLQQYIRWLRLKRAAYQLIVNKDLSIITIAINAGFESHEAFSRAFKKACGSSPSQFRLGNDYSFWDKSPYCLSVTGELKVDITIREIEEIRLGVVEHRGDPNKVGESVDKLITWSKAQPINLKPKAGDAFGFGYDDPKKTPADDFRFDLGIKVPENFKLEGVVEKRIPAGRYAVAMHKGSHETISETLLHIYLDWIPNTDEQLGDFPCIFSYRNFLSEVAETELLTECWVLLKS